jgi:hypothetical protein
MTSSNGVRKKLLGNAHCVAQTAFFTVVLDSKASGSQLRFHFIAGERMDKSAKTNAIPQLQRFLPPTQKELAKSCRPVDKSLVA